MAQRLYRGDVDDISVAHRLAVRPHTQTYPTRLFRVLPPLGYRTDVITKNNCAVTTIVVLEGSFLGIIVALKHSCHPTTIGHTRTKGAF